MQTLSFKKFNWGPVSKTDSLISAKLYFLIIKIYDNNFLPCFTFRFGQFKLLSPNLRARLRILIKFNSQNNWDGSKNLNFLKPLLHRLCDWNIKWENLFWEFELQTAEIFLQNHEKCNKKNEMELKRASYLFWGRSESNWWLF